VYPVATTNDDIAIALDFNANINAAMDSAQEPQLEAEDEPASKKKGKLDVPPPNWGIDDRISYSKETGKYLLEDDDGSEMEWNVRMRAWMPVVYCLINVF
jgi:hypothetical protein